jgi:uncharacterized protein
MLTAVTAGATLGLLNVVHCTAMCGPLSSAASAPASLSRATRYQLGRLLSYTFLGALSGHLGHALRLVGPSAVSAWIVATLTAAACLLTARSLFAGAKPASGLVQLQSARKRRSLFAVLLELVPREPAVLGMLSALLPCGVLASVLLAAVATGDAVPGAVLMGAFAAVSGVAVWGATLAIQLAPRKLGVPVRRVLALALIAMAGLALSRPIYALANEPHAACHGAAR